MESKKRHNLTKRKLIIGLIFCVILLSSLLYFYHNHWNGLYIVNSIPTSITGVGIIIVISLTICTVFVLGGFLLGIYFPTESDKKFTNLSDKFVNVAIKDFDSFPLAQFISKDDISCIAKIGEDGKISYSFNLETKFYQANDYELFLKHFDV